MVEGKEGGKEVLRGILRGGDLDVRGVSSIMSASFRFDLVIAEMTGVTGCCDEGTF